MKDFVAVPTVPTEVYIAIWASWRIVVEQYEAAEARLTPMDPSAGPIATLDKTWQRHNELRSAERVLHDLAMRQYIALDDAQRALVPFIARPGATEGP